MADEMIRCDELVKIYKTDSVEVMALQGLDLVVEKGELMCIVGNSGSGKSTFLNMAGGLLRPSAGKLFVDGKNLFRLSEKELTDYKMNTVGFVWQNNQKNLFPYLTALENVEVPMIFAAGSGNKRAAKLNAKQRKEWAKELLERVGLGQKMNSYPLKMSGGEQQRTAIAMALANRPPLLLADEPTGAVDQKTSLQIQQMFHDLNKELGLTIVIVTHDISLSKRVNRTVLIRDGKISSERIRKPSEIDGILKNGTFAEPSDASGMKKEKAGGHQEEEQEEYSVLDRAGRVQLTKAMLEEAGISGNKVRVEVKEGKIVILPAEKR